MPAAITPTETDELFERLGKRYEQVRYDNAPKSQLFFTAFMIGWAPLFESLQPHERTIISLAIYLARTCDNDGRLPDNYSRIHLDYDGVNQCSYQRFIRMIHQLRIHGAIESENDWQRCTKPVGLRLCLVHEREDVARRCRERYEEQRVENTRQRDLAKSKRPAASHN
jgi:hypothetical protein